MPPCLLIEIKFSIYYCVRNDQHEILKYAILLLIPVDLNIIHISVMVEESRKFDIN